MGKVQELLVKLRVNLQPSAALADRLCIPFQPTEHNSGLAPNAASVKKWIIASDASSSTGNRRTSKRHSGTRAHQTLLRALQHSNRTLCSAAERLAMMKEYEKPFTHAIQSLDAKCLYEDFPLSSDARIAFQLATTLHQEMAYGYKIAIADSLRPAAKSTKPGATSDQQLSADNAFRACHRNLAISQACKHLTQLALRHAQINQHWPSDIWKDFNTLVTIAARDRTLTLAAQDSATGLQQLSVQQQYACLCALYILDQKKLQAEDVRSLLVNLTKHAELITFHSSPTAPDNYCVGESGAPALHQFRFHAAGEKLRYFSLDRLIEILTAQDEANGKTHEYQRPERRESRTRRNRVITATIGIEDIYQQIKSAPPLEDPETQFTSLSTLLTQNSVDMHRNPNAGLFNQSHGDDHTHRAELSFTVENQSSNGVGLKWTGQESRAPKVQIGALFAHSYSNTVNEISWHVAVVRWLRTEADNSLHFGVESLSHHTNAVDVVRWIRPQHQSEDSIKGLLINYQPIDSKASMLILPRQKYKAGETVGYRDESGFHMVKLIESVGIHGSNQCFAIQEVALSAREHHDTHSDEYSIAV